MISDLSLNLLRWLHLRIHMASGKLSVAETYSLTSKYLSVIASSHVANRTFCHLNRLKIQEFETQIYAGLVGTN